MANVKRKPSGRSAKRSAVAAQATLTTAFMTDASAALPKGVTGFTFRAPSNAVEVFAGKPAKVKPLLKSYGEAVAKSRAAGRAVSFRVEVDPSGGATGTPLEEPLAASAALPVEAAGGPDGWFQGAAGGARR